MENKGPSTRVLSLSRPISRPHFFATATREIDFDMTEGGPWA